MSETVILSIRGVSKSFGGLKALVDVSFDVRQGEIYGIIGPNGSGKTTLINCVTGFVRPDSGRVFFRDEEITRLARSQDRPPGHHADLSDHAALLYASCVQEPDHTPLVSQGEAAWRLARRGEARRQGHGGYRHTRRDRLREGFAGALQARRDAPTGYQKRLELARCMALRPDVVFCDEVFSGLSMSEIAGMIPLIEKLKMDGVTLIMVEHRLRELFRVADTVMALNFGEKIAEGDYTEVIEDKQVKEAYLGKEGV